jgi:hypothetical protein
MGWLVPCKLHEEASTTTYVGEDDGEIERDATGNSVDAA